MTAPRLPDGSPAWYVRVQRPGSYQLVPCAPQGWVALVAFIVVTLAGSLAFFLPGDRRVPPSAALWVAWAVFIAAATTVYLVAAFRHSVPEGKS